MKETPGDGMTTVKPIEEEISEKTPIAGNQLVDKGHIIEEGEEEMQDLGGSEDIGKDDGAEDEQEEAKKETMSVMNTILDEEAEKNLHETLDFKDITGCPKNNG